MNLRKITTIALSVIVSVAVIFIILNSIKDANKNNGATNNQSTNEQTNVSSKTNDTGIENGVVAYYFYTNRRCQSCIKVEKLSKETIETAFKSEIEAKKIIFIPINVDEPQNTHYIKDYQLFSKALVISLIKNNKEIKFKNLTEIWQYIYNDEGFKNYVKSEIESLMKEL